MHIARLSAAPGQVGASSSDAAPEQSHAAPEELLLAVATGLLAPSCTLTAAAAQQLRRAHDDTDGGGEGPDSWQPVAGHTARIKSLPVELLYDTVGLALFDEITLSCPEYYLTSAEADILQAHGASIVAAAGVTDGSVLMELGAGSMRKTALLLDAVQAAGARGLTFAALDMCERSLADALQPLEERYQGSISLVGLCGTYRQGLALLAGSGAASLSSAVAASTLLGGNGSSTSSRCPAHGEGGAAAAPAGPEEETAAAECSTHSSSSSTRLDVASSSSTTSTTAASNRILLWLGSSIGNSDREQAAAFLRSAGQAMQPGEMLLVGIDQRNAPAKVAAAYNDSAGVTRAFIMNGLHHCARLLDQRLQQQGAPPAHGRPDGSSSGGSGSNARPASLDPAHFEYVSRYCQTLGRHEAFYRARTATAITLPAALVREAAAAAAAEGRPDAAAALSQAAAAAGGAGVVEVLVTAGELIHVEYAYKYTAEDVEELTAAAGLEHIAVWRDANQQYGLHLFRVPPNGVA